MEIGHFGTMRDHDELVLESVRGRPSPKAIAWSVHESQITHQRESSEGLNDDFSQRQTGKDTRTYNQGMLSEVV